MWRAGQDSPGTRLGSTPGRDERGGLRWTQPGSAAALDCPHRNSSRSRRGGSASARRPQAGGGACFIVGRIGWKSCYRLRPELQGWSQTDHTDGPRRAPYHPAGQEVHGRPPGGLGQGKHKAVQPKLPVSRSHREPRAAERTHLVARRRCASFRRTVLNTKCATSWRCVAAA